MPNKARRNNHDPANLRAAQQKKIRKAREKREARGDRMVAGQPFRKPKSGRGQA